ncbi:MAG: hypothetical protein BA872_06690 [Desulfobacterales bacterium C00003060]|nr:MAG: hypothetical protein BA872_06690 [Desulfobacterales bacterium C00003060]
MAKIEIIIHTKTTYSKGKAFFTLATPIDFKIMFLGYSKGSEKAKFLATCGRGSGIKGQGSRIMVFL